MGIAGGGPGTSAILEADWEIVVVLSNNDPPLAENLGIEIVQFLRM